MPSLALAKQAEVFIFQSLMRQSYFPLAKAKVQGEKKGTGHWMFHLAVFNAFAAASN